MFFGSVRKFLEYFEPQKDPEEVVLDFRYSRVCDHSGLEAIKSLVEKYFCLGKRIHFHHLSLECYRLLKNVENLVAVNVLKEPHYPMLQTARKLPKIAAPPQPATKILTGSHR
ncbi:MAG: sodium-independent anion transporter [Candidatus Brocadiaceae bacterium]|nr:sodium-independent anion transporter [Candidatus Brocadiaceae bacterium]